MARVTPMFIKILFLLLLQFLLLSSFWAIDIGASGICWEESYSGDAMAQGLGFVRSANTQYHLGLGLAYIIFFIQLSWMLWLILGGERTDKENSLGGGLK